MAAGERFGFYCYVRQWPDVIENVIKAESHLRDIGRPIAADDLVRAYGQLKRDLVALGRESAIAGTVTLREVEKRTRVRPLGGDRPGHRRFEDYLTVETLANGVIPGSIGIANYEELDRLGGWWVLNEWGGAGRSKNPKPLFGYFYGGGDEAAPDSSQFREHALFAPGASGDPVSGIGIVRRPMPARRFIEKSIEPIDREWRAGFDAAALKFSKSLDTIAKTER